MTLLEALAIVAAGTVAMAINAVVGSGSLLTFPTLLALGIPALTANISNNIGLAVGGVSAIWGYRRELAGQAATIKRLLPWALLGSTTGSIILISMPESQFEVIVPVLVAGAVLLVVVQPWLARRLAARNAGAPPALGAGAMAAVALTGVYGGYFGAAQGVILLGILGLVLHQGMQTINAVKNVLGVGINLIAAGIFLVAAPDKVDFWVAALIGVGAVIGGTLGAFVGRRLSPTVLRGVIVAVGTAAAISLFF